jgi:hypothetical protein
MKRTLEHAAFALTVALAPVALAEEANCYKVSETVSKAVIANPDDVLKIVERQASTNSTCICEVVKAAIVASEAERKLVGQIVAAAIEAAPDQMRTIANCAIAVAPDALPNIQAILAKYDPQSGESYAASEKGGYEKGGYDKNPKDPIIPGVRNPLDGPYLIPGEPPLHPPFVTPPSISRPGDYKNVKVKGNPLGSRPDSDDDDMDYDEEVLSR